MAVYSYIITDFLDDVADIDKLTEEIEDSGIINTLLDYMNGNEYGVDIFFFSPLTGAEETELDAIVAAHDGIPDEEPTSTFQAERIDTFTSTASAYTEVLSLSASIPQGGEDDYRLQWFTLYGIDSGLVNFRMRLLQDDTETLMGYTEEVPNADPDERIPRSGFIPLKNLKKGIHTFDLECGKETGGAAAWKIFKAFLELRRL